MVVYRKDSSKVETSTGSPAAIPIENLNGSDEADKTLSVCPPVESGDTGTLLPGSPAGGGGGASAWKPGVPRAILTCRPNSHPFPERVLSLDQPAKVGRSVARSRQAPNNAIFDCKVLSRNHALLWYENGKFYLQDTKSSNGTFVNNQRLSKGSEESPAREVCSGDIVQFGVDVVENSRKVTHGCIVATLRLFLPDGKEAKASPSTAVVPASSGASITTQDMYQLSQCIQEAIQREQILQNKMATLQRVVSSAQEATENNWKAMIEEDRLLHRIETLEAQLQACSKSATDEKLREEIARLHEERDRYQDTAKESLRKVLQEKLEAVRKVQDLEYSVTNTEEECTRLRELYDAAQKEISLLADRSDRHQKDVADLKKQLKEAEENCQAATEEKTELEKQIEELKSSERVLAAKIESLRADNDFAKEQLTAMKARFDQVKKAQYIEDGLDPLEMKEGLPNNQGSTESNNSDFVAKKEAEVLNAAIDHLKEEGKKGTLLTKELQAKVCELEELEQLEKDDAATKESYVAPLLTSAGNGEEKVALEKMVVLHDEYEQLRELLSETRDKKETEARGVPGFEENVARRTAARSPRSVAEGYNGSEQLETTVQNSSAFEVNGDSNAIETELARVKKQAKDQVEEILKLQEELSRLETMLQDVKEQLGRKQLQLIEEERRSGLRQEELDSLQSLLEEEQKARERTEATCDAVKKQLHEAQNNVRQHQNESEHLRKKVRSLTEELRNQANIGKSSSSEGSCSANEYNALREECASLRTRIQSMEFEMQRHHVENMKLLADYQYLQEAYTTLQSAASSFEADRGDGDLLWSQQLEQLKEKAENTNKQLQGTLEELAVLKEKYAACSQEKANLQQELRIVADDFRLVSYQSKTISACSIIPLCILLLAVLLGFYPSLSLFTGTAEQP